MKGLFLSRDIYRITPAVTSDLGLEQPCRIRLLNRTVFRMRPAKTRNPCLEMYFSHTFIISLVNFRLRIFIITWKIVPSTQKRTITLYIYLKEEGRGVMTLYLKGLEKRHNHLNKSESTFPKNALCQIWSKLKQLFLEDKIFKYCQCFFLISLLSFLWKRAWFFI